ncbi:hypothetical protein CN266_04585 [Bacillus cereus]|uniref:hypothetical protein n=1 Tax=Bacillus cereus TaxID=1396 RepID=UPI000BF25BC6|nr:hypothetical protein [Bacillus cereus]PFC67951.1 hypothetical protein CN266_04585 [Bacillus cereus]PFJ19583.1 hypothetical protein COI91_18430 [Bacillus cereus]PGX46189.1 hypothetical protein COE37_23070 [Bacillus cereus]
MDKYEQINLFNQLLYLENRLKKDALMEYLINLEKNGGGHITVTQVLDFLQHHGYSIEGRRKVVNAP